MLQNGDRIRSHRKNMPLLEMIQPLQIWNRTSFNFY